jgi:thymidylate synthase
MRQLAGHQLLYNRLGSHYGDLLRYVQTHGARVPSRIGETREILNLQLGLTQPTFCLIGREGFSDAFMHEEILQLLAGAYDHDRLAAVVPRAAEMITAPTAYGPRTWEQLEAVEEELLSSPTSRRAVVYIGRPDDLGLAGEADRAKEMPCTETWQFHLRDGELHMAVNMRSWDLVWGLSYDVPSFVAVQVALAKALGAVVGTYCHTAGSAHVYDRHYGLKPWARPDELNLGWLLRDSIQGTRQAAREAML